MQQFSRTFRFIGQITLTCFILTSSPTALAYDATPNGMIFQQTIDGWAFSLQQLFRPYITQKKMVHVDEEISFYDETAELQEFSLLHGAAQSKKTDFLFESGLTTQQQKYESRRVKACLTVLPSKYRKQIKKITIKFGKSEPRGLANNEQIILSIQNLSNKEVCNVVIHEAGHIIDLGYFTGTSTQMSAFHDGAAIPADDLSLGFYQLSWIDEDTQKTDSNALDFISGYAKSAVFEDYGESLTAYVRQGNYFRSLLSTSTVLEAKYNFLRDVVFDGVEYDSGKAAIDIFAREYDATRIGIEAK